MLGQQLRTRLWPFVAGAVALAVAVVLILAVSRASGSGSFDLDGTMTLVQTDTGAGQMGGTERDGQMTCFGLGGYSDIVEGAPVTVYDAAGKIVATGALGLGTATVDPVEGGFTECHFPIRVTAIPDSESFYSVEVTHRGKVTVTAAEAMNGGTKLSLGS